MGSPITAASLLLAEARVLVRLARLELAGAVEVIEVIDDTRLHIDDVIARDGELLEDARRSDDEARIAAWTKALTRDREDAARVAAVRAKAVTTLTRIAVEDPIADYRAAVANLGAKVPPKLREPLAVLDEIRAEALDAIVTAEQEDAILRTALVEYLPAAEAAARGA